MPGAVNLPLLDDAQRAQVGTRYRNNGQQAAIELGHELISGSVRQSRMQGWLAHLARHPNARLYCWRGGLRSSVVCEWLAAAGVDAARVEGGYRALRRTCLTALETAAADGKPWLLIGGRTGTGKTELLVEQSETIDLEGLAHHRGSAFGAREEPQPTPIQFENALAVAFLRHDGTRVLLEDESRAIGSVGIPTACFERMQHSSLVILTEALPDRCRRIAAEYVDEPLADGMPPGLLLERLSSALDRIRKRLGGLRHAEVAGQLERAFETGDHTPWIGRLLEWYYDPMYDYQLDKKQERVVFTGDRAEVEAYLSETATAPAGEAEGQ